MPHTGPNPHLSVQVRSHSHPQPQAFTFLLTNLICNNFHVAARFFIHRLWSTVQPLVSQDKQSTWVKSSWLHWPLLCQEVLSPLLFPRSGLLPVSLKSGPLPPGLRRLLKEKDVLLWPTSKDSKFWFWRSKRDTLLRRLLLRLKFSQEFDPNATQSFFLSFYD